MWQECNWLHALEGAIDNAHAGFLSYTIDLPCTLISIPSTSLRTGFPRRRGKGSGLNSVKARGVIDEQLLLALLADIVSFEEDIDRAVETVSVRDIGAINPALVAELFDGGLLPIVLL